MNSATPIPQFSDPEYPIRVALGKLGYDASYMQTAELDLVQWVMEAMNFIRKDKKVLKKITKTEKVYDNQIAHCEFASYVDEVKKGGVCLGLKVTDSCANMLTDNCRKVCCKGPYEFIVNECYTQFSPTLPDGTEIEITYLARPKAKSGYPKVPEPCVVAIAEYVKWMLCVRERDNRAGASETRWYVLCQQARAALKQGEWSNVNIAKLGYFWWH